MGKAEKTLSLVLRGTSDANIRFQELCSLLRKLGFSENDRRRHTRRASLALIVPSPQPSPRGRGSERAARIS